MAEQIVERVFDAAPVNAICNHPEVQPTLSLGMGDVDVSALIADERNVFLMGEHGGAMFHRTGPGVYAAHDYFLPEGRGQWALKASRYMLSYMFDVMKARMIWAETPVENRACRMFNRWLGFKSEGLSCVALVPGSDPVQAETFVMEAR